MHSRTLPATLMGLDLLCFYVASYLFQKFNLHHQAFPGYTDFVFVSMLCWMIITGFLKTNTYDRMADLKLLIQGYIKTLPLFLGTQSLYLWLVSNQDTSFPSLEEVVSLDVFTICLIASLKILMVASYITIRTKHRNRYIIVGFTQEGQRLRRYLQENKRFAYQFMGYFDDCAGSRLQGQLDELYQFCEQNGIDHIYFALHNNTQLMEKISTYADDHFIHFGYVIHPHPFENGKSTHKSSIIPLTGMYLNLKSTSL